MPVLAITDGRAPSVREGRDGMSFWKIVRKRSAEQEKGTRSLGDICRKQLSRRTGLTEGRSKLALEEEEGREARLVGSAGGLEANSLLMMWLS